MSDFTRIRRPPSLHARSFNDPLRSTWTLVVEDDEQIARWLATAVEDAWSSTRPPGELGNHMRVVVVNALGNATERGALSLMKDCPNYVLLDLNVVDSSGMGTLERVVAHRGNCPSRIAVFSGIDAPTMARAARRIGASAFIPKDLPADEKRLAVRTFVEHGAWFPKSLIGVRG